MSVPSGATACDRPGRDRPGRDRPGRDRPGRDRPEGFVAGNVYDKYRTKNPLFRVLMARFLASCRELAAEAAPESVLEVGCGPGDLAESLFGSLTNGASYVGSDLSLSEVRGARIHAPQRPFLAASLYRLPFADGAFDCVLACEVFEHLEEPEAALAEVARVSRRHLLLSVPWEPAWRLLNVARGSYLKDFGNTPGHVQHFSRAAIRRLVARRFEVLAERRPFPWTMLLARHRS